MFEDPLIYYEEKGNTDKIKMSSPNSGHKNDSSVINNRRNHNIYTCPTCNALFTCLQYYQQHVKKHAEVNGNKLLCCNHCRYSTDNEFHYNWHVMTHTGEEQHSCTVCSKPSENELLTSPSNHIKSENEDSYPGKRSVAIGTNDDLPLAPLQPPPPFDLVPISNNYPSSQGQGSYANIPHVKNEQGQVSDEEDEDDETDDEDDEDDEEEEIGEEDENMEGGIRMVNSQTQNGKDELITAGPRDDIEDETDDEEEEVESEEEERDPEYLVSAVQMPNFPPIQGPPYTKSNLPPDPNELLNQNLSNRGRGKGNRKSRALTETIVGDGGVQAEIRRKFHCSHCGKSFKTKSHLQRHILTHTGEKPYHCNRCGSKFNQSSSLRNHIIAIHTKEYPHYCPNCGKGFLMPALLQKHLATSHRSK